MKALDDHRLDLREEAGASMVEYAFLIAGIALVVAVSLTVFGPAVRDLFSLPMGWL